MRTGPSGLHGAAMTLRAVILPVLGFYSVGMLSIIMRKLALSGPARAARGVRSSAGSAGVPRGISCRATTPGPSASMSREHPAT